MDPNTVANAISSQGSENTVAILGVMIPIVAIVLGLSVAMLKVWTDYRKKREILQAHHAERMAAIEKGIELPPLPPQFYGSGSDDSLAEAAKVQREFKGQAANGLHYLRSGLMWLLIGIAISIALYAEHDNEHVHTAAWWGAVPAAFGLSRLLFYFIANRMNAGAIERGDQTKPKE
jgi:hypothetical protein